MPGAAFSVAGGSQSARIGTSYLLNVTGAQPLELPGMAGELFVRNPSAAPMVKFFEKLPKLEDGWDDIWRWTEAARLTEVGALAGSTAVGGVILTVDDGNIYTPRDVLMVDFTYYCTVDSIDGNNVTIAWNIGDAPAGPLPADTPVIKISTAYRQIDAPNVSPLTRKAEFWNGWNYFLTAYEFSQTYRAGNFRFGPDEAFQIQMKDSEFDEIRAKTYYFGQRSISYPAANNVFTTMRGVWRWAGVTTDMLGLELTHDDLEDFIQGWCTGNIMDGEMRVCHCPLNVLRQIDTIFQNKTIVQETLGNVVPKTWSVPVNAYTVAGKTINFVHDPILDMHGWHDILVGVNWAPSVMSRRNKRGKGPKHNESWQYERGAGEFACGGHIASEETMEIKWAEKNIRCMENLAVLTTA
jgi:hypothetical protein